MFDRLGAHRVEVMERNEAILAAEKPHPSTALRAGFLEEREGGAPFIILLGLAKISSPFFVLGSQLLQPPN